MQGQPAAIPSMHPNLKDAIRPLGMVGSATVCLGHARKIPVPPVGVTGTGIDLQVSALEGGCFVHPIVQVIKGWKLCRSPGKKV